MRSSSGSEGSGSDGVVYLQCELTGWLKGFGSDGRMCRWAIMAWSRSLSFANCEGRQRQMWPPKTTKFRTGSILGLIGSDIDTGSEFRRRQEDKYEKQPPLRPELPRTFTPACRHALRCLTSVNAF